MKKMNELIQTAVESKKAEYVGMLLASGATVQSNGASIKFETEESCTMITRESFLPDEMKAVLAFLFSGARVSWDDDRDALIAEYTHFYVILSRTYNRDGVYWSAGYVSKALWSEFIELFDTRKPANRLGFFAYSWKKAKAINHDLSWCELVQVAVSAKEKDQKIKEKIEGLL